MATTAGFTHRHTHISISVDFTFIHSHSHSHSLTQCEPYQLGEVVPGQYWYTVLDTSFGWTISVDYTDYSGNLTQFCKYTTTYIYTYTILTEEFSSHHNFYYYCCLSVA